MEEIMTVFLKPHQFSKAAVATEMRLHWNFGFKASTTLKIWLISLNPQVGIIPEIKRGVVTRMIYSFLHSLSSNLVFLSFQENKSESKWNQLMIDNLLENISMCKLVIS